MALFGKFLTMMFGAALSLFARFFVMEKAAKLAAFSVALSIMLGLITAMMSCITGVCAQAISGLGAIHQGVAIGLGIAVNATTLSAISCYMTVWVLCSVYVMKKKAINAITGAG